MCSFEDVRSNMCHGEENLIFLSKKFYWNSLKSFRVIYVRIHLMAKHLMCLAPKNQRHFIRMETDGAFFNSDTREERKTKWRTKQNAKWER